MIRRMVRRWVGSASADDGKVGQIFEADVFASRPASTGGVVRRLSAATGAVHRRRRRITDRRQPGTGHSRRHRTTSTADSERPKRRGTSRG